MPPFGKTLLRLGGGGGFIESENQRHEAKKAQAMLRNGYANNSPFARDYDPMGRNGPYLDRNGQWPFDPSHVNPINIIGRTTKLPWHGELSRSSDPMVPEVWATRTPIPKLQLRTTTRNSRVLSTAVWTNPKTEQHTQNYQRRVSWSWTTPQKTALRSRSL